MINKPVVYKFSKTLLTTERRLTGQYLLGVKISPIFLNRRTTNDNFQHSGKQDYFRHILKRPASMYEKPGSWIFRITTGIQSRPRAIDKARFVMTSLTILGVTKNYAVTDQFQKGKQVKRYLSVQDQSYQKSFQHTNLFYQMQTTTPPAN